MRISDWSSDVCSSDLPSAGADRKKETGCNGHPFPTMPHRLIVVGLGLDLFPLAGQEPAQRENFAGTFISIAERGTQRERSEERRVGKEGVSTGRSRRAADSKKIKRNHINL